MDIYKNLLAEIQKNLEPTSRIILKESNKELSISDTKSKTEGFIYHDNRYIGHKEGREREWYSKKSHKEIAYSKKFNGKYQKARKVAQRKVGCAGGSSIILLIAIIIALIGLSIPIRYSLKINFWESITLTLGIIITLILINYIIIQASKFIISFKTLKPQGSKIDKLNQPSTNSKDEIYLIIEDVYQTLSYVRLERERQAKGTYNLSIALIISGAVIVFSGILLLFKNKLTSGSLTSGVGAMTTLIGRNILKFYKETNDRMDSINNDLFMLNTIKVQYAIILRISDEHRKNQALDNLISSISNIKKQNQ